MSEHDRAGAPEAATLLAQREHLRAVLRMMPVGVVIVDARGRLVEANPAAEAFWGSVLPRGLEHLADYEGYWPGSGRRLEPQEWALARTLRDGQPVVNEEVEVLAPDGTRHTLLLSTTALRDGQGALLGVVAVQVDITARRRAEHADAFLSEATRLLVESLDWEDTLRAVARLATRQLAEGCLIDVLGDDGELRRLAIAAREPEREALLRQEGRSPPRGDAPGPVARVFAEGRSLLLPDPTSEHSREALGGRACLVVPMSLGERRLGVISFIRYTPGLHYTEREVRDAEELARRAAFLVEHARLLRETRGALLESFLAASPVGMAFLDRELRYVLVNPVLATLNGKPIEEHLGRSLHEVLPEVETLPNPERLLRGVLESGRPVLEQEGLVPAPLPTLPPHTVRASFFPVRVKEETLGVGAVVLDVTEQKRVEAELRFLAEATARLASSLDLRTTLESTARVVVEHLADYCMVDVRTEDGRGLERMAVASREPHIPPRLAEALRHSPPPLPTCPLWQVVETGQALLVPTVTEEMLADTSGGEAQREVLENLRPRSTMLVPLIARGRALGVLSVVRQDPARRYTERDLALLEELAWRAALAVDNARHFQQAERAVAARDEFMAIATHELRTPLSALRLQLVALLRAVDAGNPPTPERLRYALTTAQRQTERLEQLVHHLLDVSRVATGRLELEHEEVDLSALVRWLVTRLEEKLAESGVTVEVHADTPVVARVDRLRVEQVLMNLLTNAMKYAPGLPVEVRVEREERMAVISVRDHGTGISPDVQARIFERYQRASGQHSRVSLGLGLYLSRQIARAHGGELKVESTPGQGSCFLLLLPLD